MPKISENRRREQFERILAAAASCFSREGYHPTTVDDIANEAGLSKGSIYTYFESKERIFLTLAGRSHQAKLALLSQSYSESESPWTKLCKVWCEIINSWASVDLQQLRVTYEFWMEASQYPDLRTVLEARYAESEQVFTAILQDGIRHKQFSRTLNVHMLTRVFWAMTDGLVGFWLARAQRPSPEELAELMSTIRALLAGAVGLNVSVPLNPEKMDFSQ